MSSSKSTLRLIGAFAVLGMLALAISCKGFFVNQPTSVTITPSAPTFTAGQQQSLTAQAAFSNNNSKVVTTSATWNSSNPCIVAIITSGENAGNATDVGTGGSATITASYNGVIGTATASVPGGLTITPCPEQDVAGFPEVVFSAGTSATFTATGATSWQSANSSVVSFASASSGAATFPAKGQTTITVSDSVNQGTLLVTVQ